LNGEITRQATIIAFNDDFKLMMIVALAAMPLVFLLRRATQQGKAEAILE
jgi:DHA2 family multidrug resistance protein